MRYHPLDPPRPLYYRMARSAHFLQAGLPQPMKPIAERERVADSGLVQCPRPSEQTIFLVHLIPNNGRRLPRRRQPRSRATGVNATTCAPCLLHNSLSSTRRDASGMAGVGIGTAVTHAADADKNRDGLCLPVAAQSSPLTSPRDSEC